MPKTFRLTCYTNILRIWLHRNIELTHNCIKKFWKMKSVYVSFYSFHIEYLNIANRYLFLFDFYWNVWVIESIYNSQNCDIFIRNTSRSKFETLDVEKNELLDLIASNKVYKIWQRQRQNERLPTNMKRD